VRRGAHHGPGTGAAGYRCDVVEAAERHDAAFTITAKGYTNVKAAVEALALDPTTTWEPAVGAEEAKGSEVAETMFRFAGRDLRMIVRRQPTRPGDQLSFDDLDGWRFHAIITNIAPLLGTAADVEHHHRLRGGAPEEAIRQLKEDFGLCHAPLENFFGNWVWWQAATLAYNVARWVRVLALPPAFRTCRGKRLRLASSTSPPGSCTPVAGCSSGSLVPMPMPARSSRPSLVSDAFASSPDDPGRRTPAGSDWRRREPIEGLRLDGTRPGL